MVDTKQKYISPLSAYVIEVTGDIVTVQRTMSFS